MRHPVGVVISSLYPPAEQPHNCVDKEGYKNLQLKFEEAETVRKVSEVERERLGQHVRVLTKRLKVAEDNVMSSEAKLRSERRENAKLQKQLEKAHVELRETSATSEESSQKFSTSLKKFNEENIQLKEELLGIS